jgi:hypothetical protein
MPIGIVNILSLLYLSLVVALVFSINDQEEIGQIVRATLRRWGKLVGVLVGIGIIVYLLGNL